MPNAMRRVRLSCLHNVTQENVAEHRVELADCRAPHPEMSEDVAGGLSGKEATIVILRYPPGVKPGL